MTRKEVDAIITEYKEYQRLQDELEAQMDSLKDEIKAYMVEAGETEHLTADGSIKCTYVETISRHPDYTAMKKDIPEIYNQYLKVRHSMRFLCK